jgi:Polyketide cyclase / dehydrase and lipid transport
MKMSIKTSTKINASADRVWEVIAKDFLNISKWARDVNASYDNFSTHSKPEGAPAAGRFCEVSGFGKVDEHILHYDNKKREITWTASADKMPGFVSKLQNAWTITQIDDSSAQVSSHLSADLTGLLGTIMYPLMKLNFSKLVKGFVVDLSTYAETNTVSSVKKKQLEKLSDNIAVTH